MIRRRRWPNLSVFILLGCLGLLVGGCGKKGPPSPPLQEKLPKVNNLQAVVVNNGVKLTWSIGSSDSTVVGFKVYRSKVQTEISDCPGCEKDFEPVSTISVKSGRTQFQLVDQHIKGKGRFYYKVTPFDNRNRPGPDSNEAMVLIE